MVTIRIQFYGADRCEETGAQGWVCRVYNDAGDLVYKAVGATRCTFAADRIVACLGIPSGQAITIGDTTYVAADWRKGMPVSWPNDATIHSYASLVEDGSDVMVRIV